MLSLKPAAAKHSRQLADKRILHFRGDWTTKWSSRLFFEKILEARAHLVSRKQSIDGVFQGAKFRGWKVDSLKMT